MINYWPLSLSGPEQNTRIKQTLYNSKCYTKPETEPQRHFSHTSLYFHQAKISPIVHYTAAVWVIITAKALCLIELIITDCTSSSMG